MSIKVLTNYDFLKNQIENAVVHNVADLSLITTPRQGQIAFNTTNKRLYYYDGIQWEGSDALDAIDYLNGNDLIDYINNVATTNTINNNRLTNSSITLGTTTISLGGTVTDIAGSTINSITLTKNDTGFSLAGGTTSKTLTISGTSTIDPNAITLESTNKLTMQYAGLTLGALGATGDITIKSIDTTDKTLTLSNSNLELAGTGTKLTVNDTPTISGAGSVALTGATTIGNNSITFNSTESITAQYASLTIGSVTGTGNITIKSLNHTDKTLTLSNSNLELAGTGTKLTVNDTPTISGTGSVSLADSASVTLAGDSLATFNTGLTVGTTNSYSKAITLKTTEISDTTDIVATFPKVSAMTLVGEDTIQALTNKTINGLTITPVTSKTLNLSVASLTVGASTNSGTITITSDSTDPRTLTLGGSVTLNGASSATLNTPLTVGATSTYTGAVSIKSAGTSPTEIIGPNGGTVTLVAGTMVETSDTRLHMQNTDVGTSNSTFYLGTNGIKLKSVNTGTENIELQVRDNADNEYANIRVKNLYVEGTQTIINTEELSIEDSIIQLNRGVTTSIENTNSGLSIKRFNTSTNNEQPAELIFNESTGRWQVTYINTHNTGEYTNALAMKFSVEIGNGVATQFIITHNLNTRDAIVSIRETGNTYAMVLAEVRFTDENTITVFTAEAPTANQYTVTIIG